MNVFVRIIKKEDGICINVFVCVCKAQPTDSFLIRMDSLLLWVNVCDVFLCMCGCVCHCVCSCVVVCVCVSMWAGLHMAFETSAFIITIPSSSPSSYQGVVHHHHSHFLITSSSWISLRPASPSSSSLSSSVARQGLRHHHQISISVSINISPASELHSHFA